MKKLKVNIQHIDISPLPYSQTAVVTLDIPLSEGLELSQKAKKINGGKYIAEIKKPRKSQNMNSYMWVICDKIAGKIHHMSKEDVYRQAIRHTGKWVDVTVPKGEAKKLITGWQNNGLGWFAEVFHTGGETISMRCYIGSSVYDHNELRKLTNFIVEEAQGLGIETATPAELDHLEYLWSVK